MDRKARKGEKHMFRTISIVAGMILISAVMVGYGVSAETISEFPVVKFTVTPSNGTAPLSVFFMDQSELDPGVPDEMYNYIWTFGDDSSPDTSNARNIGHEYANPGVYKAELRIMDQNGSFFSSAFPVVVNVTKPAGPIDGLIQANFTAAIRTGYAPLTVSFIDQSTSATPITNYTWDFGDGSEPLTGEKNPEHTFIGVGQYDVSLTVNTSAGLNSTTIELGYITVQPSRYPVVKFTSIPREGSAPQTILFLDQSELDPAVPDEMYTYIWNFGDGSPTDTSNARNIEHTYTKKGTYTVELQITDQAGSVFNAAAPVVVDLNSTSVPAASFTAIATRGLAPVNAQFIDTSIGGPVAWKWYFGDGNTSSEPSPNHTYQSPGVYNVTLDVFSKSGGLNSTTKTGFITALSPTVQAKVGYVFANLSNLKHIQFYDTSEGVGINNWAWDFGDGSACTDENPVHEYSTGGKYPVSLTISNGYANSSTIYMIGIN